MRWRSAPRHRCRRSAKRWIGIFFYGELRKALGDAPQAPRFIATVHRRGYRFIAPVTVVEAAKITPVTSAPHPPLSPAPSPLLVGREAELRQLHGWLAQVRQGARQVVFVTGEAGIGKTTVMETFLADLAGDPALRLMWGQCLQHYGAGEAYLPVLDALGRLCREPGGAQILALLA